MVSGYDAGILGSGYDSVADAVRATEEYGQSAIFDLGGDSRAGTRPWEVAEWLFSDDGTEGMSFDTPGIRRRRLNYFLVILILGNGNADSKSPCRISPGR